MKVIFLDIDGVLNSELFYQNKVNNYKIATQQNLNIDQIRVFVNMDPDAIATLNDIVDATGAEIVISSAWRNDLNIPYKMRYAGLKKPIYGITPRHESRHRGMEIQMWLDRYKNDNIDIKYVILDDDTDMLECQSSHFVHIDNYHGLTKEYCEKIISILNK